VIICSSITVVAAINVETVVNVLYHAAPFGARCAAYKYVFHSGNLERWFYEEKIFLYNSSLCVYKNKPASHMVFWKNFTNDVIKYISENNKNCVFLLLGNFAKSKEKFICNKDKIIKGVHPSPLSAHHGFFSSNIFKMVETKLGEEINWSN
jgi:uracil-DNA glycosylase